MRKPKVIRIYEVVCSANGMRYIGLTNGTTQRRWWQHVNDTRYRAAGTLQAAIREFGQHQFTISIIDVAGTVGLARKRERELIADRGTMTPLGYNMTSGGEGSIGFFKSAGTKRRHSEALLILGMKRPPISDETRAKKRALMLGRKQSPETIEKRAAKLRGRPAHPAVIAAATGRNTSQLCRERTAAANRARQWAQEARDKLRAFHTGLSPSPEAVEKTAAHNRGRKLPLEQRAKMSAARLAWWAAHRRAPTVEVRERKGRP